MPGRYTSSRREVLKQGAVLGGMAAVGAASLERLAPGASAAQLARNETLYDLLNRSVNETLPRTVMTGSTTLACLLALLIFGGEVIRPFAWVLTFGIVIGTFSSIYVAAPLLTWHMALSSCYQVPALML